jgi:hypothetical protein
MITLSTINRRSLLRRLRSDGAPTSISSLMPVRRVMNGGTSR